MSHCLACGKQSLNMYEVIEGKGKRREKWMEYWGERKRKGRRRGVGKREKKKGFAY